MLFEEDKKLLQSIVNDKWEIASLGHSFNDRYILGSIEENINYINEFNKKLSEDNPSHSKIISKILNNVQPEAADFEEEDLYTSYLMVSFRLKRRGGQSILDIDTKCDLCGDRFSFLLIDQETKTLTPTTYDPSFVLEKCEVADWTYLETTVNVDNNLLFTNFFKENGDLFCDDDGDLDYLSGMQDITTACAKSNVLYGQTGNMSIYIYKKDNNLVILDTEVKTSFEEFGYVLEDVSSANNLSEDVVKDLLDNDIDKVNKLVDGDDLIYHYNYNKGLLPYKDWDYKGSVSCEMWRYMAASQSTISDLDLEIDHWTDNPVVVDMKSGTYELKHYYRVSSEGPLISEIKLIK